MKRVLLFASVISIFEIYSVDGAKIPVLGKIADFFQWIGSLCGGGLSKGWNDKTANKELNEIERKIKSATTDEKTAMLEQLNNMCRYWKQNKPNLCEEIKNRLVIYSDAEALNTINKFQKRGTITEHEIGEALKTLRSLILSQHHFTYDTREKFAELIDKLCTDMDSTSNTNVKPSCTQIEMDKEELCGDTIPYIIIYTDEEATEIISSINKKLNTMKTEEKTSAIKKLHHMATYERHKFMKQTKESLLDCARQICQDSRVKESLLCSGIPLEVYIWNGADATAYLKSIPKNSYEDMSAIEKKKLLDVFKKMAWCEIELEFFTKQRILRITNELCKPPGVSEEMESSREEIKQLIILWDDDNAHTILRTLNLEFSNPVTLQRKRMMLSTMTEMVSCYKKFSKVTIQLLAKLKSELQNDEAFPQRTEEIMQQIDQLHIWNENETAKEITTLESMWAMPSEITEKHEKFKTFESLCSQSSSFSITLRKRLLQLLSKAYLRIREKTRLSLIDRVIGQENELKKMKAKIVKGN